MTFDKSFSEIFAQLAQIQIYPEFRTSRITRFRISHNEAFRFTCELERDLVLDIG